MSIGFCRLHGSLIVLKATELWKGMEGPIWYPKFGIPSLQSRSPTGELGPVQGIAPGHTCPFQWPFAIACCRNRSRAAFEMSGALIESVYGLSRSPVYTCLV